jgi:hypothetical protein
MVFLTGGTSGLRDLWERLVRWRVHAGWYAVALLGPALLWIAAAAIYFARKGAPDTVEMGAVIGFPALFLATPALHSSTAGSCSRWRCC